MKHQHVEFLVLGAGLQGSAIALELALRGKSVTLIDQDPVPVNRASLRNEGKIHLGLIYAADPSLRTAVMQLRGALQFRRLLERWTGKAANSIGISTPFTYLVAADSLLQSGALEAHYEKLDKVFQELMRSDGRLDYLGLKPEKLTTRAPASHIRQFFDSRSIPDAFLTEERAINPDDLARIIRSALSASERITFIPNFHVREVERMNGKTRVSAWLDETQQSCSIDAEHVINATWGDRLLLDKMAGLPPPAGWVHRLKYRAITRLPKSLRQHPSATMVLGRYGDVVIRPDDTAYLSWYPAGLKGWNHDLKPPQEWSLPCRGKVTPEDAAEIGSEIMDNISAWCPKMQGCELLHVDAGVIFAYGQTDVDNKDSGLHDRIQIGFTGGPGYLSVDPGKLTTAPYFAIRAVEWLLDGQHDTIANE